MEILQKFERKQKMIETLLKGNEITGKKEPYEIYIDSGDEIVEFTEKDKIVYNQRTRSFTLKKYLEGFPEPFPFRLSETELDKLLEHLENNQ